MELNVAWPMHMKVAILITIWLKTEIIRCLKNNFPLFNEILLPVNTNFFIFYR